MTKHITQSRLKEVLHYDPKTGVFTCRIQRGPRRSGDKAGTLSTGYILICVDYRPYCSSPRVADMVSQAH